MTLVAICLVIPQRMRHRLAPLRRYGASNITGVMILEFDLLGSRDVIGHLTIRHPGVDKVKEEREKGKGKEGKEKRGGKRGKETGGGKGARGYSAPPLG